jgi:hypothetical protein
VTNDCPRLPTRVTGTAPLDRLLAGRLADLAVVRDLGDAQRWWVIEIVAQPMKRLRVRRCHK